MKKYILKIILSTCLVFSSVYGYFGADMNFIDFLVHSNQLSVRTDRFGILAGPSNVRVAVGITGANNLSDLIIHNIGDIGGTNGVITLVPSVLAGIGYEAGSWGIGAGYEFTYKADSYMVHTPVVTATFMDDALRINVPVSVGVGSKSRTTVADLRGAYVVSTAIEARYYFPKEIPVLSQLRFFVNYGNAYVQNVKDKQQNLRQQSFGLQARIYFKIETPEVLIEPILRVQYDQALKTDNKNFGANVINDNFSVTAKSFAPYYPTTGPGSSTGANGANTGSGLNGGYLTSLPGSYYAIEPYRVGVAMPVGFTAKSLDENISFYLEPALSFTMIGAKHIYQSAASQNERNMIFGLGYVVYGELYIRPVKNLEWYFELQTGGATIADNFKNSASTSLVFNGKTGLSYYF